MGFLNTNFNALPNLLPHKPDSKLAFHKGPSSPKNNGESQYHLPVMSKGNTDFLPQNLVPSQPINTKLKYLLSRNSIAPNNRIKDIDMTREEGSNEGVIPSLCKVLTPLKGVINLLPPFTLPLVRLTFILLKILLRKMESILNSSSNQNLTPILFTTVPLPLDHQPAS